MDDRLLEIDTRAFRPTDMNLMLKSIIRSSRQYQRRSTDALYYPAQERQVRALMQRPTTRCLIACERHNEDFVFGFALTEVPVTADADEPLLIHYIFTKLSYRGIGVARILLRAVGWRPGRTIQCTYWGKVCHERRSELRIIENPFFLRGDEQSRFVKWGQELRGRELDSH